MYICLNFSLPNKTRSTEVPKSLFNLMLTLLSGDGQIQVRKDWNNMLEMGKYSILSLRDLVDAIFVGFFLAVR